MHFNDLLGANTNFMLEQLADESDMRRLVIRSARPRALWNLTDPLSSRAIENMRLIGLDGDRDGFARLHSTGDL
ncbi:MAG: hypothetical protein QOF90_1069, partial [Acetobacteraceae bacterium]|nr:hypothetical protein [Acetobacteraceae bacterium]